MVSADKGGEPSDGPAEETTISSGTSKDRKGFLRLLSWSFAMEGGKQIITLVLSLVLAGLLGPEVFGVSAMAFVFVSFIDLVQRQGMGQAIVQRKNLDREHLDTAFWMVMGVSVALTVVGVALSGWWADFNRTPQLGPVTAALALLVPLNGLTVVQQGYLWRRMEVRALTVRSLLSVTVGGIAGTAAALMGAGVWALVLQQLLTALVEVITLWVASDWRPRMRASRSAARDLLGFSGGSFLSALAAFFGARGDVLALGYFFGPLVVGLYRFAARLVQAVFEFAARPIASLALPELSPHQGSHEEGERRYLRLTRVAAWLGVPLLGVLAGVAEPVVLILGEEWLPAAPALQWLALGGIVKVLTVVDGPMMQSRGRAHLNAAMGWTLSLVSMGVFVVIGLYLPLEDVPSAAAIIAAARSATLVVVVFCLHSLFLRITKISLRGYLKSTALPVFAAILAFLVSVAIVQMVDSWGPWWRSILGVAAGLLVVLAVAVLDRGLRGMASAALRRLVAPGAD